MAGLSFACLTARCQMLIGKDSIRMASIFSEYTSTWKKDRVVFDVEDKTITCYRGKDGRCSWYSITYSAVEAAAIRKHEKSDDARVKITLVDEKDGRVTVEFRPAL